MKIATTLYRLKTATLALLLLGVSAYAAGEKADAKKIAFTAKSGEAKQLVDQIVRGIESFQAGPQLQALAQKAVEADPQFAFGYYLLGTLTPPPAGRAHIDKAVELSKSASDGERRYIEAVLLTRAQKHEESIKIFTELSSRYPEERMVQMMLGQVYTAQGKLDEAKAAFERAIKLDGSTPRVYTFLGNISLLKGDYAKARDLFKTSLGKKVEGTAPFAPYYGLVYTNLYEGDVKAALDGLYLFQTEYVKTGGAANLPPVFVWNSIGRLLLENGRAEESLKAYEKGYETVASSALDETQKKLWLGRLHHGKGRALAKLGKHAEAWKEAELIKKMIDEGGEQAKQFMPSYHYIVGYLKLESGDYASAVEHLKQSDLNDPFHKLLLARAYEKSGDQANAQKLYKEITAVNQVTMERALSYPEAKKKLKS